MSNRQWKSWGLGLVVCGLSWAVGCQCGKNPPEPKGETGGTGGTGTGDPGAGGTGAKPSSPSGSGSTLTLSAKDGSRGRFGWPPKPPKPPKMECCRAGEKCAEEMPLCTVSCPGDDWACPGGTKCSQGTDGEFNACVDECAGPSCGDVCCAAGATCEDGECAMGDLTITAEDVPLTALSSVNVPEGSCSIQQGCVNGSGARQVAHLSVQVSNVGDLPVEIGEPWDSPAFYHSSCSQQYLLPNFIQAEVLNEDDEVVATGHLPTSCVVDDEGGNYLCSVQGLSPDATSQQPESSCDTLDLTGLLSGNYGLRLTVNADRSLGEKNFANNSVEVALNLPECDGNYCGGVCCPSDLTCSNNVCMAPDLRPHQGAVEDSVFVTYRTFGENSCEIAEACVGGTGRRRLLNFEGRIENLGPGDLNPGPEQNNPLYEFSECHGHYHFLDFTDYRLLDGEGAVAAQGHKQSFCLVDMDRVEDYTGPSPGEHPEPGDRGCSYLSAGWADIYGVGTDCQWVDVTDVPAGNYVLQVAVNPLGRVSEMNISNNVVQVPVYLPDDGPCQEEVCGDIVDQDCDGNPDKYDDDCHDYYEAECCNAENSCDWHYNSTCDCNGEFSWDYWACYYYGGEGGAGGGSGSGGPGGECCSMDDPCDWGGDGWCDCYGEFPWDAEDCEGSSSSGFGASGFTTTSTTGDHDH